MEKVIIYTYGPVSLSCCCDKTMTREEVEEAVNRLHSTGIESAWRISEENFKHGESNPCPCQEHPVSRQHWLLKC